MTDFGSLLDSISDAPDLPSEWRIVEAVRRTGPQQRGWGMRSSLAMGTLATAERWRSTPGSERPQPSYPGCMMESDHAGGSPSTFPMAVSSKCCMAERLCALIPTS